MSRDRFRNRGGGGGAGMSIYRRGSNGGRGMGMHNFRGHGYMEQNRGPPPQHQKPLQQQQQKPPQQPSTPEAPKPLQQAAVKPQTPAQPPAASPQTKPPQTPQQKPGSTPQPPSTPAKPTTPTPQPQPPTPAPHPQHKTPPQPPQPQQKTPQPLQKPPQQQQKTPQQQQQPPQKITPQPGKPPLQQPPSQQPLQQQQRPRPGMNSQAGQKRPYPGQSRFSQQPPAPEPHEQKLHDQVGAEAIRASLSLLRRPGEKTYTQRCRLFVGNLPADITEEEFKLLFAKYGEPGEVFINKSKGFGFIKLESRALSEIAKAELDDYPMRGRQLRVRFATHSAALSVRNLSPYVSNELLEEAFSQFGPVERAVVIVDDRGRSTGKGIVEFAAKPAARKALERCNEGVFLLTTTPMPVIVEPLEQFDAEDGLPEKLAQKNHLYQKEREIPPRFAQHGTFEFEYSKRWKSLDDMEKQQRQQVEKNIKEAKEKLESEMEDAYHEHQANLLRQDLMRRQEELRRMEEIHNQEMQKRKEMQLRQEEERRRREEEMLLRQRDMEEQMMRQRDDYRMGYMDPREREMRMGANAMAMGDPYGSAGQKYPPLGAGMGYDGNPGVAQAALMGSDMRNDRFAQGNAGTPNAQGSRGIGSVPPASAGAGYGRARDDYEGPNKKPRF